MAEWLNIYDKHALETINKEGTLFHAIQNGWSFVIPVQFPRRIILVFTSSNDGRLRQFLNWTIIRPRHITFKKDGWWTSITYKTPPFCNVAWPALIVVSIEFFHDLPTRSREIPSSHWLAMQGIELTATAMPIF